MTVSPVGSSSSALITAVALTAAAVAQANGRPWQSVVFTVLGLAQLGVALAIRGEGPRNRSLDLAVGSSLLLQLGGVWLEPLRSLLGTAALSPADLALCAALAAVPGVVTHLLRRSP